MMMARVNSDQPPGYSVHQPSLPLPPPRCGSVRVRVRVSSRQHTCRPGSTPRGTPSQLRISSASAAAAAAHVGDGVASVRMLIDSGTSGQVRSIDRARGRRHYARLWEPIDPFAPSVQPPARLHAGR